MPERRKPKQEVTPSYEDSGLFKNPIGWTTVQLIPRVWQNRRRDVLISGLIEDGTEIEVLFAGRRSGAAAPLTAALNQMRTRAIQAQGVDVRIEDLRLPVVVKGAWRPRFEADRQGWQTRFYQLVVSDWRRADGGAAEGAG